MPTFIPEPDDNVEEVPFYEDVAASDGWSGQTTTKSIETLKQEVISNITRLGGITSRITKGVFDQGNEKQRQGFIIEYSISGVDGKLYPGKIEIAALPVRRSVNKDKSMRMALFMYIISLKGVWFLQKLSPGYAALMPFMLADGKDTISQKWTQSAAMSPLLPPPDDTITGNFTEIK